MKNKTVTLVVKENYFDGENRWVKGETFEVPAKMKLTDGYYYSSNRCGQGFTLPRSKFVIKKS